MKRCKRCHFPDTRPGMLFDEYGECQACTNYDKRKEVNWFKRRDELKRLCAKYKRDDGYYDCVIGVSGGKDSYTIVQMMKQQMGMNPLLVTAGDQFTTTKAGAHNLKNLCERFNCDHIKFNFSPDVFKRTARISFEEEANPLDFMEAALYALPFKVAMKFNIPLIVFGENTNYEYGCTDTNYYDGTTDVVTRLKSMDIQRWEERGFDIKELNPIMPPRDEEMVIVGPRLIYLSYFHPWSSTENLKVAKKYGFKDLGDEWDREGYIENFEQIDSVGYLTHLWLKYPKFGFQRTTDIASRRVREGGMSLEEAKRLIAEKDPLLDRRSLKDFIDTLGYTKQEFWDVVDKHTNKELFPEGGPHK